jgi:hypothetical protein
MVYVLVCDSGRVLTFTVLGCAEVFRQIYGGSITVEQAKLLNT